MAANNTDFLRFSAYSVKDLITRKLSEDTKWTDQVYEGSNLAILIDIVSYMYQVLIQNLNTAAAESMFADTQLYRNIVRLVKFIGYNPKGCNPSSATAYLTSSGDLHGYILPRYAYVKTGITDSNGKEICFSTQKNMSGNGQYNDILQANGTQTVQLYNGRWKMYGRVFTASGVDNETFVLDELRSDSAAQKFVAHQFIDVYVRRASDGQWERDWTVDVNSIFCGYRSSDSTGFLFNNRSAFKSLYPGTYPVYNVTLNENKQYEVKFGNGVVGRKLQPGDAVYVFYLDTNGPDGKVDFQDVDQKSLRFRHSAADFGMSDQMYKEFFGLDQGDVKNIVDGWDDVGAAVSFRAGSSSTPALEEGVEDIRENAPMNFMAGNRLVTRTDYEYYLKSAHMVNVVGEDVVDVKCMNNWEYMASFYRWLYQLGVNGKLVEYADAVADPPRPGPDRYLQKANFIRYEYFYADAADANNIYIWLKTPSGGFDVARTTSNLNQQLQPIKVMTAEIVACKAIDVEFAVCAAPYEYVLKNYLGSGYDVQAGIDRQCESYIEVTLDDNAVCVPSSVKSDVREAILQAFDVNRCSLGQVVRFDQILDGIYAIDGVVKVRTVFRYYDSEGMERSRAYDGLSFASWSDAKGLIRYGDDLNVSNTMRQLEEFQFPVFSGADTLDSRIKVIKKSLANVNTIKF